MMPVPEPYFCLHIMLKAKGSRGWHIRPGMTKYHNVAALRFFRADPVGGFHPYRQIPGRQIFPASDTAVLMVFTALLGVIALPVIWLFEPRVLALSWLATGVMTLSGILYMGAMLFYLRAIQTEEASVVAPLFQANTLFTFALGILILHEMPRWPQLVGRRPGDRGRPGPVAGQETASAAISSHGWCC